MDHGVYLTGDLDVASFECDGQMLSRTLRAGEMSSAAAANLSFRS